MPEHPLGEKLHPLHIVITIGAIILGSILAFGFVNIASGVGMTCKNSCQDSTHAKPSGETTSCTPTDKDVATKHPEWKKLKNKKNKTPAEEQKFKQLTAELKKCADENLNNCKGRGDNPGEQNPCKGPGDPTKGKGPKKDDGKKEDPSGNPKPPEMPKIPEMPKKEPKPQDEKKNEDCLAQGKTQEQCDKEKKGIFDRASSAFNDIWKNLTGQTGEPEVRLDDSAKKLLDSLNTPETTLDAGEDTGKKTGAELTVPTGPKGTTNGPNPLEQQRAGQNAPPQGHSKGGTTGNTFGPEGNPQPPAQNTNAGIQAVLDRLRDLFRQLFGF